MSRSQPPPHVMLTHGKPELSRVVAAPGYDDDDMLALAAALESSQHVHAGVLPQEKHCFVTEQRQVGKIVAMAGDGTNDAPALAAAHVGIAMGSGTDFAIQSAAVTLVQGALRPVARRTRRRRASRVRRKGPGRESPPPG